MTFDVGIIGAGMAGLTAGALLTHKGKRVCISEQNWLPGGCVSSYPRHGYVFESGATTLVGLDEGMPLRHVLDLTGIEVPAQKLQLPMQIHFPDGTVLNRYQDLEAWIGEAERVFGAKGQREFWEYCYKVSRQVWGTSLKQTAFPPTRLRDVWAIARKASLGQVRQLPRAYTSTAALLKRHGLDKNERFCAFVDEQLLITAQNFAPEVNVLFGATALCYTNDGNYYVRGGMLKLVQPFVDYIKENGGEVLLRHQVKEIEKNAEGYLMAIHQRGKAEKKTVRSKYLLSAIPLNNTLPLFRNGQQKRMAKYVMPPGRLRGAFSMGIAFKRPPGPPPASIHHQIHLDEALPYIGGKSIFVSLSHPEDLDRCATGECVASVSMHIFEPDKPQITDKQVLEEHILNILEEKGFLCREDILYQHASTPVAWEKWTGRAYGFVGGYPQYMAIKPWQMKDARLDGQGAYICGDSTYPGQGIPGACLSGIAAVEKMRLDHGL